MGKSKDGTWEGALYPFFFLSFFSFSQKFLSSGTSLKLFFFFCCCCLFILMRLKPEGLTHGDLLSFYFSDEEAVASSYQATHERLHGLFAYGKEKDNRATARHSQRRSIKSIGQKVEGAQWRRSGALHSRSREAEAASHATISRLQISTAQEDETKESRCWK